MASKLENVFGYVSGLNVNKQESHSIAKIRSLIANWACKTGLQQCNDQGLANSRQWQKQLDPDSYNP